MKALQTIISTPDLPHDRADIRQKNLVFVEDILVFHEDAMKRLWIVRIEPIRLEVVSALKRLLG